MSEDELSELSLLIRGFIEEKTGKTVSPIMYDCDKEDSPAKHPRFYVIKDSQSEAPKRILNISLDLL